MPSVNDAAIGNVIIFQSKAVNDKTHYRGEIVGFVQSNVARGYGDIFTYNTNVQSVDPNVASPDLLDFMLVKLLDGSPSWFTSSTYIIPFAKDWIDPATFDIIASESSAMVRIYDVDQNNVQDLLNYLRAGSWKARLDKFM